MSVNAAATQFRIRRVEPGDRPWLRAMLAEAWGAATIVTRGRVHQADELPGFVATIGHERIGAITYCIEGHSCEVTSLNSRRPGLGVGTALLEAVRSEAREHGCRRLWLITTNDNTSALRFYQRRGWHLTALYPNALAASRLLKPEMPLLGMDGIPLRDEIELELCLA